jgi:hypothetical protein
LRVTRRKQRRPMGSLKKNFAVQKEETKGLELVVEQLRRDLTLS